LQLISANDLKRYWQSDHYGKLSRNVLSRPAIIIGTVDRVIPDNPLHGRLARETDARSPHVGNDR